MKSITRRTSLFSLLALSLVAIFSVGCGNSDNFVFTGNNIVSPDTAGNLSFRFNRAVAQTVGEVPAATTQLLFSLHSGNPPTQANLVEVRLVPYSDTVVLEDVDPSVTTVVVVALSDEQFPLVALQGDATVIAGTTQPVDLGAAEPITFDALTVTPDPINVVNDGLGNSVQASLTLAFSNGSDITLTNYDAPEVSFGQNSVVANITSTGSFSTAIGGQNTTATASYNLFGTVRDDDFEIRTFFFKIYAGGAGTPPGNLPSGGAPAVWGSIARFIGPDGVIKDFQPNSEFPDSFSSVVIDPPVTGISLDTDNHIVVDSGVTPGTSFNLVITYTDPGYPDVPVTDTLVITVSP